MTRNELIAKAHALPRPSAEAAREYAAKGEYLATELNRIMAAREDLPALIGPGNQAMMEDNHRNHARFVASLLHDFQPEVLVDTVLWVLRAYRAHGFQLTYWPAQLNVWMDVLKHTLTPQALEAVVPIYLFMLVHQPAFVRLTDVRLDAAANRSDSPPGR